LVASSGEAGSPGAGKKRAAERAEVQQLAAAEACPSSPLASAHFSAAIKAVIEEVTLTRTADLRFDRFACDATGKRTENE
jgi:hypothetical protein